MTSTCAVQRYTYQYLWIGDFCGCISCGNSTCCWISVGLLEYFVLWSSVIVFLLGADGPRELIFSLHELACVRMLKCQGSPFESMLMSNVMLYFDAFTRHAGNAATSGPFSVISLTLYSVSGVKFWSSNSVWSSTFHLVCLELATNESGSYCVLPAWTKFPEPKLLKNSN